MPLPLVPLIGAGASLLGSIFNAGTTMSTNRQQLEFQREMYDKQRADSLADWNMNNEYNSPTQQMMRLKAAGLNPHLVYGNGTKVTAEAPAPSNAPFASLKAPQFDVGSAIGAYTNLEANKAQVDNMRENIKTQLSEQNLKDAQRLKLLAEIPGAQAQSAVSQGIVQHQIKAAELQNNKIEAETSATLSNAEQNRLQTSSNIEKATADIIRGRIQSYNETRRTTQDIEHSKESVRNMSQGTLESAYRIGQIIRTQDLTDQQLLTEKERTEAERLQNEYQRGLISRNIFEKAIGSIVDAATSRLIGGKK